VHVIIMGCGRVGSELAARLEARGHTVAVIDQTSGAQAIVRTQSGWIGGADPRREGTVNGE